MPLTNLEPSDTFDIVETKLDAAIDKVNQIDDDLTGGTTGQILKKSSNSDYDYEWGTPDDITVKADKTQLLIASASAAGPTSYSTETTMLTLTPSATQSAAVMKYTFMGYLTNNVIDTADIKIKKAGVEIASTLTDVSHTDGKTNFCLVWIDSYTANQSITATVTCGGDGGALNNYILICESLNAI